MSDEGSKGSKGSTPSVKERSPLLDAVKYRQVRPTDIPQCIAMEKASYTNGEASSKNELQYRQHHAAKFFRCAVLKHDEDDDDDSDEDEVVGYICSIRCEVTQDDIVCKTHNPDSTTLLIKSMVVHSDHRREGLGLEMLKHYIQALRVTVASLEKPICRLVIYVKEPMLPLYIHAGFTGIRPSRNTEFVDRRYFLELPLTVSSEVPRKGTSVKGKVGRESFVVDSFADGSGTGNPACGGV